MSENTDVYSREESNLACPNSESAKNPVFKDECTEKEIDEAQAEEIVEALIEKTEKNNVKAIIFLGIYILLICFFFYMIDGQNPASMAVPAIFGSVLIFYLFSNIPAPKAEDKNPSKNENMRKVLASGVSYADYYSAMTNPRRKVLTYYVGKNCIVWNGSLRDNMVIEDVTLVRLVKTDYLRKSAYMLLVIDNKGNKMAACENYGIFDKKEIQSKMILAAHELARYLPNAKVSIEVDKYVWKKDGYSFDGCDIKISDLKKEEKTISNFYRDGGWFCPYCHEPNKNVKRCAFCGKDYDAVRASEYRKKLIIIERTNK